MRFSLFFLKASHYRIKTSLYRKKRGVISKHVNIEVILLSLDSLKILKRHIDILNKNKEMLQIFTNVVKL